MIANDLFLVSHDAYTGRPLAPPDTLAVGLAGALFAELILTRCLTIHQGRVYLLAYATAPQDRTQQRILEIVTAESDRFTVDAWLRFIGAESTERVAERLVRARAVKPPVEGRVLGMFRRPAAYCAVDPTFPTYLPVRLRRKLDDCTITVAEATLVGLIASTDLIQHVPLWDGTPPARVGECLRGLPQPLFELIKRVEVTHANVVLAR